MKHRDCVVLLAGLAGLAVTAGCGSDKPPPPPPPTTLAIKLTTAPNINPDGTGAPEPLRVRVLQLADTGTLARVDFFTFDADPAKALGPDLLATQDLVLRPGQTLSISAEAKPGTKFVGIVGAYYAIDQAKWRAWVPVKPNTVNNITVNPNAAEIVMTAAGT